MRASESANFWDMRLQMSSNWQRPRDLVAHWLQAMQPRMGLLPI